MRLKAMAILFLLIISSLSIFADEDDNGYEGYFETINENISTSPVMSFIGNTADEMLYKIKDGIMPGIVRLSAPEDANSGKYSVKIARPNSFVGTLISVLLTLECVVLGIKSFLGEDCSLTSLMKHLVILCILLAFIALLPIIGESLLRILVNAGAVVGGEDVSNKSFAFTPSSVIKMLESCKTIIDEKRASLGGLSLKKLSLLPDILMLFIASVIIAIPYIITSIAVIFWYIEFYIIILAGVVALPFSFFTYTSITDMKSILRALLMVGMKVFLGVALATLSSSIITEQLENNDTSIGGTINLVVYLLLMTIFFVFGVLKGPQIFMNALSGNSTGGSGSALTLIGATTHLKRAIHSSKKSKDKANNDENSSDGSSNETTSQNVENETPINTEDYSTLSPPHVRQPNVSREITSNATAERINSAYEKFQSEGVKYVSVERVKERARWEATYDKLSHMKENNFRDESGAFNSTAASQYARMAREKNDYLEGKKTWDGEKIS